MAERTLRVGVVGLLMALALTGCDRSSGAGAYAGSVQTEFGSPGSILMLVTGDGLVRAEGTGGTLAWSGQVSGDPGEMLLLLVDPDSAGATTFRLFVRDLSGTTPSFTVLQMADRRNERFEAQDIHIRLER